MTKKENLINSNFNTILLQDLVVTSIANMHTFRVRLEIVIRVNTIYGYHNRASTQLRYQRFENCLEVEPRVGTPICRSLVDMAPVWSNVNKRDFIGLDK